MSLSLPIKSDQSGTFVDDPFLLHSRTEAPLNFRTGLDYCRFLYHSADAYRAVFKRVVGHFVTALSFKGEVGSIKEREEFEEFLVEEVRILDELRLLGENFACYGNGFIRVNFPFNRLLIDRREGFRQYSLSMFPEELVRFDAQTMTYEVPDPKEHSRAWDQRGRIHLTARDAPSKDFNRIRIIHLDPRYCRLRYSEFAGLTQVEYEFSPEFRGKVRRGELFEVNRTPLDVLETVAKGWTYLYNMDSVYHLKNPTVCGVSNEGWGLPEILAQYPRIHKLAVYDRIDEAVGRSYMLPFRVVAPDFRGLDNMGMQSALSSDFVDAVRVMYETQRRNPEAISGFPLPFVYQEMGGSGKSLTPADVKEFEVNNLMTNLSIPLEVFKGSLQFQMMPSAIRMFENSHAPLGSGLNGAARFITRMVSAYRFGEEYKAYLRKSMVAEDMDRRNLLFSLYSSAKIPADVAFEGLDLEGPKDLEVRRAREDLEISTRIEKLKAEEERKARLGTLDDAMAAEEEAQGGAGGAPTVSPLDLRSQGEQLAQQWLAIPNVGERQMAMRQVASTNPDLYAVAKDVMSQIRAQGESQGRQMAQQQFQQPGGPVG